MLRRNSKCKGSKLGGYWYHLTAFGSIFYHPTQPSGGGTSHVNCSLDTAIPLLPKSAQKRIFQKASKEIGKKGLPPDFWELGGWVRQSYHLTTGPLHIPEPPAHYRIGYTQQKTPRFPREKSGGAGDNQKALCSQSHCVPHVRGGVRQGLWPLPAWKRPSLHKAGPGWSLLDSASTLLFGFQQIL